MSEIKLPLRRAEAMADFERIEDSNGRIVMLDELNAHIAGLGDRVREMRRLGIAMHRRIAEQSEEYDAGDHMEPVCFKPETWSDINAVFPVSNNDGERVETTRGVTWVQDRIKHEEAARNQAERERDKALSIMSEAVELTSKMRGQRDEAVEAFKVLRDGLNDIATTRAIQGVTDADFAVWAEASARALLAKLTGGGDA